MRVPRRSFTLGLSAALSFAGAPLWAQDGWSALARPDAIGLMRHALAPGTGDLPQFRLGDCATQRNLDARGRAQAEAIGAAIRARGLAVAQVWTSQWCRCRDTATLMAVGPVTEKRFLNSFFRDRSGAGDQTEALRAAMRALPEAGRTLIVTHQVNITALTGIAPRSGEIVVLGRAGGELTVTGRLLIAA
jgi:phosphohistidine phosphatase SixA